MGNSLKGKRIFSGTSDVGLGGAGGVAPVYTDLDPVISQTNTPPAHVSGERYLINTAPTGAWVGSANNIAESNGAAWAYTAPTLNDYVYITSTLVTLRYDGTAWVAAPARAILQNGNSFGISGVIIGTNDAYPLRFKTNNLQRILIDASSGELRSLYSMHIGASGLSSAGTARLHVRGIDALSTSYALKINNSASTSLLAIQNDGWVGVGIVLPLIRFHILVSGTDQALRLDNGTYNMNFVPNGTSTLSEIQTTNVGYQFNSVDGYFRMNRASAGVNLFYINGGTGLALSGVSAGTHQIFLKSNGQMTLPNLPTSNAGLVAGELYYATSAVILSAGDYVIGRKA